MAGIKPPHDYYVKKFKKKLLRIGMLVLVAFFIIGFIKLRYLA